MADGPKKVLTPEDVRKYIDGGYRCPYCGGYDFDFASSCEVDGGLATQPIACPDCGATWNDVYFLDAVDINDDDGYLDTVDAAPPGNSRLLGLLLAGAEAHGRDGEPDHEVGDLRSFVRAAFALLTPRQLAAFWAHDEVRDVVAVDSDYDDLAREIYPA